MIEMPDLEELCYEGTNILLVELPVAPWTNAVYQQLYALENRRGLMPMIAHLDRYIGFQKRSSIIKILEMGYPIQVSADALFYFTIRGRALEMLANFDGLLISDCHNTTNREPNYERAKKIMEKKLGHRMTREIIALTDEMLTD
jgi:protein-tyrosine phosphatase